MLFDSSGSVDDLRPRFLRDFDRIVDEAGGGDWLLAGLITHNTDESLDFQINEEIPSYRMDVYNQSTYQEEVSAQKNRMRAKAEALTAFDSPGSDVLGGFGAVESIFHVEKCADRPQRRLIIFSDMIEESTRYNFRDESLGESDFKAIIESERNAGAIPDLGGIRVWLIGSLAFVMPTVDTDSQDEDMPDGLDSERERLIRDFWVAYVRSTQGNLVEVETTLLGYP